ncbi:hypothetical protein Acr_27g0003540 [Actinidia rufa]|uniref:DUF4283 domain-containing protein n=1 Tax=Actinidia rufa TaxID=165716 RepID=A0A7J0H6S5_9ERIC|nr:hypothetical protein Acr_27g0003540 [Actinidia rufa]
MAKGKNKPNEGGQWSISIRHVEIEERSIAIMSESGTLAAKTTSYADSREISAREERDAAGEKREEGKTQRKASSFAGLFTENRMPSKDRYFSGRFLGKQPLRQITNSWKVQVTVKNHGSGWLIFQFSSEDDKASVLGNRPYIIYGRPLLLKAMPHLFKFGNKAIRSFPFWVQLSEERVNVIPVTAYQIRDFKSYYYDTGISDLRSTGAFHTWSNNIVWSKLDRAMVNTRWIQEGLIAHANHSPCVLSLFGDHDRGASFFKFFNVWAQHESFLDLVTNVWSMRVEGTTMFRLCKKLKALKDPLKTLNKHNFSHVSTRVEAAKEELNQAQQNAHDNPGDVSLQIKVPKLRMKIVKLPEPKRCFYAQLAKAKCPDVCKAIREFSRSGKLLKQSNHAVLVPKSANASRVEEFKPIACCNVIYKLISKILAKRISPILEELINLTQAGFVLNRNMVENIYLVQELLRKYG